ncbi:MAG: efflux RND transporter permease subunit [Tahibacter sp.]
MFLSDISVKRPVLATVISLMLIVLGLVAFTNLPLRELPDIDTPIVSVQTTYRGADAAVVESRVTKPLEDAISGIEGIRTVNSSSQTGQSQISIEFGLNREIESAANDVRDAVSRVVARLPEEADPPQIFKVDSSGDVIIWFNLASTSMNQRELTDYAERYVVDRLSAVDGVANIIIGGEQRYAMRLWIDREALAARALTVQDLEDALSRENVELPAGAINSTTRDFTVRVLRGYSKPVDFAQLVIRKGTDGHLIRVGEVARVELGSVEPRNDYRGNGKLQLGLGVVKTSTANELEVVRGAKAAALQIQDSLPEGSQIFVAYDATIFVDTALHEVYKTLIEAILLVLVVIWLFLGSVRAALIPAVTVPVCIITAFAALYVFGFSINLLTLLALVLAIGLVVDDAIVVLENCQRRVDLGEPRLVAAYRGARQVGFAVIATTAVLVAVFLPIGFMGGYTGRLFRELSVAIAAAVAISGVVALSLTPMMCSKLLISHERARGLARWLDVGFQRVQSTYATLLRRVIGHPWLIAVVMLIAVGCSVLLLRGLSAELAPIEDRGAFVVSVTGPEGAGYDWTVGKVREVEKRLMSLVDQGIASRVNTRVPQGRGGQATQQFNTGQAVVLMAPWDQRKIGSQQLIEQLRKELADIPGIRITPTMRQSLTRGGGLPLQFVLQGPDYVQLADWRDRLLKKLEENPRLYSTDSDYKETQPQIRVEIDKSRAADLGVSTQSIGHALESFFGGRRVTTFSVDGEEYDVMVQADDAGRRQPNDLSNLYVRSDSTSQLIPLSNLVSLSDMAAPGSLNRFNRLRSITISGALAPGYSLGEAIAYVEQATREVLPANAQTDLKGESRDLRETGSTVAFTFGMALLVVFLVLAAQFESFVHPFVIMLTVPLAVLGALLGLWLFGSTLNLYSQIGIIMLIGLAAKNGILIVEFANQLRDQGRSIDEAIRESAAVRLRPIVMTSIATVVGALPLMFSAGAGSASRQTIGTVVVFGVMLSTFLSLFVVPVIYRVLAGFTRSPEAVSHELSALSAEHTDADALES